MTLPPGWEAVTDPQSGRTYYQNRITQTTQWELPFADPPPQMPPPSLLEDVRAKNHHLRWHKAQLAFGILFSALWLCAMIAQCVYWARIEGLAAQTCRDKPEFQFHGYQEDYAHCDTGFVCKHFAPDFYECQESESKLCSDPEAAAACSDEDTFSSGFKSDKCFEKARPYVDTISNVGCEYPDENPQQNYYESCKMVLGIPCPDDGKYFCRDPSALAACSGKGSESGSCYKQFGLDVCIEQEADTLYSWTGTSLALCAIGLLFAACAVGSSILYNTCNCYKPPTKSTLLTIARLSEIAAFGEKRNGILYGKIERMPTNF